MKVMRKLADEMNMASLHHLVIGCDPAPNYPPYLNVNMEISKVAANFLAVNFQLSD